MSRMYKTRLSRYARPWSWTTGTPSSTYARFWGPANSRGRPGWNWWKGAGPVRGSTRFSSSGSSEAGHCSGRRRRSRPCSRPLWTGPKALALPGWGTVCRGPGVSPGLESGRDSARTHRSNATSSPDTGGSAVSAGSHDVRQWLTVTTGPTAPQLGAVGLASLFPYGSSLWRGQWQGEFKDSVY